MNDSTNPFAAPMSPSRYEDVAPVTTRIVSASKWLRFANYVVDAVVIMIAQFMIGIIYGLILISSAGPAALDENPAFDITATLLSWLLVAIYYIVFEAIWGRTIGKLVTGTIVVSNDGTKPSFGQILGRTAARFIPFEPFSLLLKEDGRGWHDSLPSTYVVKKH